MCNYFKKEIYNFYHFIKSHISLIISISVVAILSYGYEASHFVLTIDEEAIWDKAGLDYFLRRISDGRFALGFAKPFFPRTLLPFWSTALFSIIMAFNGCLLVYTVQDYIKNKFAQCIIACVFISYPIHAYYIMFSNMSVEAALGYGATICAVYMTESVLNQDKIKLRNFIFPTSLVILANGVYQAFFSVYILLVCCLKLLQIYKSKEKNSNVTAIQMWKNIGKHILCLMIYAIGYIVVVKVLQIIFTPSRHYIEGFLQWGNSNIIDNLNWILHRILNISLSIKLSGGFSLVLVYNICFAIVFFIGLFSCKKSFRILWIVSSFGMFVSNFMMLIIAGGYMPERTYLTLPIYSGISMAMLIESLNQKKISIIIGLLGVLVVLNQTAVITDLFWAEERQQTEDQIKLNYLINEVADLAGGYNSEIPVIILNQTDYSSYDGTFGFSYLDLGGRLYGYLHYLGFDYVKGNKEQNEYAAERQKTMPEFPQEGSIIYENNTVIVNLNGENID